MRPKSIVLAIAVAVLLAFYLAGCKGEAPQDVTEEVSDQHMQDGHDASAPDTQTSDQEPPSAEDQAQALSTDQVDPRKFYSDTDMETLSFIALQGNEEDAAKALSVMRKILAISEDAQVRRQAAGSLGVLADQALPELANAAVNDPEPEVRQQALESLGNAKPSPELTAALEKLRRSDDATMRAGGFRTLMEVYFNSDDKQAAYEWAAAQLGDEGDDVSAQVMMKLHQEGADALPACVKILQTSPDADARAAAACVIGVICAGTNPQQQKFADLSRAMTKEETDKPGPANLDGLAPLTKALEDDPSAQVRALAAQGLGYLGEESSAPLLGKSLHDESELVRWWAARALITVPNEAAVDDLAEAATEDQVSRVRRSAVIALGWSPPSLSVEVALMKATQDAVADVRRVAAEQLGRAAAGGSLEALAKLINDPDQDVRWAAVQALGELKDPEAAPILVEVVRDPNPMVANAAERALQKMGIAQRRYGTRDEN